MPARTKPMRARPAKVRTSESKDPEYRTWILRHAPIVQIEALSSDQADEAIRTIRNNLFIHGTVVGHHVRRHGERKNDRRMVPLIDYCHVLTSFSVHDGGGNRLFEKRFGCDFETAIACLNAEYDCEHGGRP